MLVGEGNEKRRHPGNQKVRRKRERERKEQGEDLAVAEVCSTMDKEPLVNECYKNGMTGSAIDELIEMEGPGKRRCIKVNRRRVRNQDEYSTAVYLLEPQQQRKQQPRRHHQHHGSFRRLHPSCREG